MCFHTKKSTGVLRRRWSNCLKDKVFVSEIPGMSQDFFYRILVIEEHIIKKSRPRGGSRPSKHASKPSKKNFCMMLPEDTTAAMTNLHPSNKTDSRFDVDS